MAQRRRHRPAHRILIRLLLLALPLQCVLAVLVATHGGHHLHLSWPDLGAMAKGLQCRYQRVTEGASPLLRHGAHAAAALQAACDRAGDTTLPMAMALGHGHDHHDHDHSHPRAHVHGHGAHDDHGPADEATRLTVGSVDEAGEGAPVSPPWLAWLPLGWVLVPVSRRRAATAAAPGWRSRCVPPPQRPPRRG
jgi:hypothetical protein